MDDLDLNEKLTLDELERYHGWMVKDAKAKPNKKMTRGEFLAMVDDPKVEMVGIHHDSRELWLKNNGYDVTRANMLNTDLKSKG